MWIFTKTGFVSCVKCLDDQNKILVRGRQAEDVLAFVGKYSNEYFSILVGDYTHRAVLTLAQFNEQLAEAVNGIDYPNFKDSIPQDRRSYHNACMSVWQVMHDYQEGKFDERQNDASYWSDLEGEAWIREEDERR
ncbi:hypothetical protein [Shewanella sp.]|uniref:hypothetical protein n=1 Tax=Shewanella sp. TaxID=50422 RepID=UPI003F2F27B2